MTGLVALALASDPRPDDNNVVAGWVGAVVFVALILAVAVILRSFTRQIRKVDAAKDAGVFGDETAGGPESPDGSDGSATAEVSGRDSGEASGQA